MLLSGGELGALISAKNITISPVEKIKVVEFVFKLTKGFRIMLMDKKIVEFSHMLK
jgi:hypothetical protein